jgi:hypothetical protein
MQQTDVASRTPIGCVLEMARIRIEETGPTASALGPSVDASPFLSVDVGPMSNTNDNHLFRSDPENYPAISDPQAAVSIPLAGQRLDVTLARLRVASQREKNSHRGPRRATPIVQTRARRSSPNSKFAQDFLV